MRKLISRRCSVGGLKVLRSTAGDSEGLFAVEEGSSRRISLWQDLPPTSDAFTTLNSVFEVPRGSFAKLQLTKDLEHHPIVQDTRKLGPRPVPRYFQLPVLFNYGFVPQTWEDCETGLVQLKGDDDPLDTVELSGRTLPGLCPVRCVVLGALGLIDQGEMDWKILLLNLEDAERSNTKTLAAAIRNFGPELEYIKRFFAVYKQQEGKPANSYIEDGRFFDEREAMLIVRDNHEAFRRLLTDDKLAERAKTYWLK